MRLSTRLPLLLLAGIAFARPVAAEQPARHPLDPLSASELLTAVALLRAETPEPARLRISSLALDPPEKRRMLSPSAGPPPRRALAVLKRGTDVLEARLDLSARRVTGIQEIADAMPPILLSEDWLAARELVSSHPPWLEALRKRGLARASDALCVPMTVGRFEETPPRRRLVKVVCFDAREGRNFWTRPIEGLLAVVDLEAGRVLEVRDGGPIPIPPGGDLEADAAGPPRAALPAFRSSRPQGSGFRVAGHRVGWQRWRFHQRIDPRVGPIVSLVEHRDGEAWRPLLYEGAVSELFVPYMDADDAWYFRLFLDAGEYGLGRLLLELEPDRDCPAEAHFFGAAFVDEAGDLDLRQRASCLYERRIGDSAWRHHEAEHQTTEVRQRSELVLRSIPVVGNYDYVLDWIFREDGSIRVEVTSSGVLQIKGVEAARVDAYGPAPDTGVLVARHALAVNHDHFFSFRLDLDVDGPRNRLVIDTLQATASEGPRRALWKRERRVVENEREARLRIDLARPALWRVESSVRRSAVGHATSYQLVPGRNARNLLPIDAPSQRRAGFSQFHLWATPHARSERYAAGAYPNQAGSEDGLARWSAAGRSILDTDLVLWYTLGFHHVPRPEDWPVMPSTTAGFSLRPFGFFDLNPALDLPD